MYERFIAELKSYSKAIRILSKGYLPISLIPPSKLEQILNQVKLALAKTKINTMIYRLYLYYDMKLVMFGIDNQKNLIIPFLVFVQPYTQTRLTLYQVETVPVPILDTNNKAQSYAQLKIEKPYIALNVFAVFAAALLAVVIMFIIIYIISGQSKLKTLVANIALQCVKAIEAVDPKGQQNCEFGLLKLLMILNLIIITLIAFTKLKKSRIFQCHFFSNMVNIKLFIADTKSYVPLELNKLAGNVHLFKLTGTLLLDNVTLKKNWIWDVLEVNWDDVHVTLNEREINLPMSLVIPIEYKMTIRKLFRKKNSLHLYIMLKQRKSSG